MSASAHKSEVIGAAAQAHTSPFSSHGYALDASTGSVLPSISYAFVVGDTAYIADTIDEPWWNLPRTYEMKKVHVEEISDSDSECPSLEEEECEEETEDLSVVQSPIRFGLQLGYIMESLYPDERCEVVRLNDDLKIIEDSILMFERFPVEARGDMSDMYLERERLRDKIRFLTPVPPPRIVEEVPIAEEVVMEDDVYTDYWKSIAHKEQEDSVRESLRRFLRDRQHDKYRRKNANRRASREAKRISDEFDYFAMAVCQQSGGAAEPPTFDKEVPVRITNRQRREAIQREKAHLRKKQELRESYSKQKSKTTAMRRKKERMFKYEIEVQSGLVSKSFNMVKSLASIPATLASVNDLVSNTVDQVNSPDSEIQRVISHSVAAVIKLGVVADQASNTIESVANNAFATLSNLDSAAESVSIAAASVPEAATAAKSTFDALSEIVTSLKTTLLQRIPAYLVNSLMAGFLYYVLIRVESPLLRAIIIGMTGLLYSGQTRALLDEVFKGVVEVKNKFVGESAGDIQQQSGVGAFPLLAKVVGTVLVGTFLSNQVSNKTGLEKHLVNSIGAVPRVFKGIESVMEAVVEMAEKGINLIRAYIELPPIKFSLKLGQAVADLAKEVYEFEFKCDNKSTGMRPVVQHTHLMGLMHKVNTQLTIHSSNREIRDMLRGLKSILLRLVHPIKHVAGKDKGFRPQPASVIISGKPGIGKTLMTQTIALTIMKLCNAIAEGATAEEASQAVFVKPYNSAFMDGYNGQFAYLIDDLFAIIPNPNSEANSFADIMTYYGCYTAMLNMADCEMKGMYPFTSRLILMTTNCRELHQACASAILLDQSAFRRRIDFHVELIVKPEFRMPFSHMLDSAKFAAEVKKMSGKTGLDRYPWHIWEYFDTQFDGMTSVPDSGGKPLKELLIKIAEKIKLNETYHGDSMEMLNDIVNAKVDDSWIVQQSGSDNYDSKYASARIVETLERVLREEPPDSDLKPAEICPPIHKTWFSVDSDEEFAKSAIEWLCERYDVDKNNWKWYKEHVEFFWAMRQHENVESPTIPQRLVATAADVAERAHEFSSRLFKAVGNGYNICPKLVKAALMASLAIGAGVTIGCVIKWLIKVIRASYEWMSELIFGKPDIALQSNGPKPRVKELKFIQQQSGGEVIGAWYNVYKNTYKMAILMSDGTYNILGQIMFLRKNLAVMPYHFLKDISDKVESKDITLDTLLEMRSCSSAASYKVLVSVRDFFTYNQHPRKDRDLVFINFNGALRPHKDIIKFFLRKSEINDVGGYSVRLDTARMDQMGTLLDFNERVTYLSQSLEVGRVEVRIGDTLHKKWLRYSADTRPGDCGAVLSLTDSTAFSCRFVLGIHVGHDPVWKKAYATPIDYEVCMEADTLLSVGDYTEGVVAQSGWSELGVKTEDIDELPFNDGVSSGFGSFEPLKKVSPEAPLPFASQLVPTALKKKEFFSDMIAGFYGGKEPEKIVIMKIGSYRDKDTGEVVFPMLRALAPFASSVRIIDQHRWRIAMDVALQPFSKASIHFSGRTLTFEEAVIGCPAMGLKSIERKSSVGYPCSIQTGNKSKSYYFGTDEVYDLDNDRAKELKNDVECLLSLIKNGIRPYFVCRDFLKDETRKLGKDARLIAGTDIRYYILCRMYFGAWVAALTKLHNVSGLCLGMNQYSEWDWLKQHILRPGDKVWDGDFAGFDQSQQPSMLWPILESINDWYSLRGGAEDNDVRKILFYDLAHSRHLVAAGGSANTIVQWSKSLPSGHFLTSAVNSTVSSTAIVSGFISTTGELDFWSNAALATLGDDNLCSTSDKYIDRFNQVSLADHLKKAYGMTYTAGRKGEDLKPYMNIKDVVFLQRQFATKYGRTVCPIRPESFLNSLYYTKRGSQVYKDNVTVVGLENALQELAMHTEEQWNRVAPGIAEALGYYNQVPQHSIANSRAYFDIVMNRVPDYI